MSSTDPSYPQPPPAMSVDPATLHPLSPEVISRQATINIGTIGHVAHGKSTVVKAISGVQTVRFRTSLNETLPLNLDTPMQRSSNVTMSNAHAQAAIVHTKVTKTRAFPVKDRAAKARCDLFDTFLLSIALDTTFSWQPCLTVQLSWTLLYCDCWKRILSTATDLGASGCH
ncbi:hypothetical protein BASA62_000411 [Batrachochytrium salamandrivorans]|nr:hypothetical protein BASA62_000411 [Batrachochytrium salamandrivorans]